MNTSHAFLFLILLSLLLTPFQSIQAALVSVEKTSTQLIKQKQANRRQLKKHRKKPKQQFKKPKRQTSKKLYLKPEHQNSFKTVFILLIVFLSIYVLTAILLMIFGFIFALVGLWVTGIILLSIPLITLLAIIINEAIFAQTKRRREEELELQEEKS